MFRTGQLKHRGNLLQKAEVSDSGAPESGDWAIVHEHVWAKIEPMRGQAAKEFGFEQDRAVLSITIRYKDGISNRMRFRHLAESGTTDYDISHVEDAMPHRPRRFLRLICTRSEIAE